MKKTLRILLCMFFLGLTACSFTETKERERKQEEKPKEAASNSGSKMVTKEESKPREDKVAQLDTISLRDLDKFHMFDREYQLAIVVALFNKVILVYDYGIGNADFLFKSNMTQFEIDTMKQLLQTQVESSRATTDNLAFQSQTLLQAMNVPNKDDVQSFINAENNYLKIVDKMIACLKAVTIENAQESRQKMNQLKHEYVQQAAEIGLVSVDIAHRAGLDIALYRNIVTGFLK